MYLSDPTLRSTINKAVEEVSISHEDFTDFCDSYVTALLWSSTLVDEVESEAVPVDEVYDNGDLSEQFAKQVIENCSSFLSSPLNDVSAHTVADALTWLRKHSRQHYQTSYDGFNQGGHDFALTRNHHGVGFWDRGIGVFGQTLTRIAYTFGETTVYVIDDALHLD